ncbi:hypothetical protein GF345_05335 [Candidatus Woesearchaeota archaeon]|nr:hypothetical protein [Candidatus Woesearchaeota archaeon]
MVHIEIVDNTDKVKITKERMLKDKRKHVIFMTYDVFCRIFTPERTRMLEYLSNNKVESISDLARKLGRKFEAVYRDLKYLEGFSVVKLRREEANKIPYVDEDINIRMVSANT